MALIHYVPFCEACPMSYRPNRFEAWCLASPKPRALCLDADYAWLPTPPPECRLRQGDVVIRLAEEASDGSEE